MWTADRSKFIFAADPCHPCQHLNQRGVGKWDTDTPIRAAAYAAARLKDGAKPGSVNYDLAYLRRMLNLMKRAGRLSNPAHIALLKVQNARQGFIDQADFEAVVNQLPEHLRDPIRFLYLSAWRSGEMKSLTWADVYGRTIRLRPENSKSGHGRTLKLWGELEAVIQRAAANRHMACEHVFHHGGRKLVDFQKAWKAACERAGHAELLIHDLRRSAIRNLTRAGVSEHVAMAISGHRTRSIFDRYDIVAEDDLDAAMAKLDSYVTERRADAPKVSPIRRVA
jgi:integrase